jgi:uncharacterized Zn finger protein
MTLTPSPLNGTITTQLGNEGLGQQPWWVEQWMELINSYRFKKRLERAWEYARSGNVTSIRFEGRRVHARVQGTDPDPYKVKLWLDVLNDDDWGYVLDALTQKARWSAQLLAGVMPQDIERAFAASGKRLFPFKLQEVRSECSCPDKANPCKHVSAVYYLMGDRFSEDPFVLFQLRGRTRGPAAQRSGQTAPQAPWPSRPARPVPAARSRPTFASPVAHQPVHSAITDPSRWWRYERGTRPGSGGDHARPGGRHRPRCSRSPAPGRGTAVARRPTNASWPRCASTAKRWPPWPWPGPWTTARNRSPQMRN